MFGAKWIRHQTLVLGLIVGLMLAMQPATALADPGGPRSSGNPPQIGAGLGLRPNLPLAVHFKDPASCWGFSSGGSNNPSFAYGSSYNDCTGDVLTASADVHLIWCVAVILNTCNPWLDLGTMTSGQRIFIGPGGFWTPAYGNAIMGGLTPGYSFMVRTTLTVLLTDGTTGQGWSSSSIFRTPMP